MDRGDRRGEVASARGESVDAESPGAAIGFGIDPPQVLRVLLIFIAVLVALSTAGQAVLLYGPNFPLRDGVAGFLYVDWEQSVPTLYSTLMLLAGALLCAGTADGRRRSDGSDVRHWWALALIFGVLALDEFASLHERLGGPIRSLLNIESGPLFYGWVVPAMVAVGVFAVVFLRFLGRLPRATRRGLWTAGALFVGGAIGVEMLGASYDASHQGLDMTFVLIVTVEETLEMIGVAVFVATLLAYIPIGVPDARWTFRVAPSVPSQGTDDGPVGR
jgi:hypothetical protein